MIKEKRNSAIDNMSETGCRELAAAIVLQAVNDFRSARKFILKHIDEYPPDRVSEILLGQEDRIKLLKKEYIAEHGSAKGFRRVPSPEERMAGMMRNSYQTINETSNFFHSDWYKQLTDIDPEALLKQLQSETYE